MRWMLLDVQVALYTFHNVVGILGDILLYLSSIFGQVVFDILEIIHDIGGGTFKLPFNIIGGSLEFFHPLAESPGQLGNLLGSKQ